MQTVQLFHAKSLLSRLVDDIEQGKETEIIITKNGRPVAKLVPFDRVPVGQRIGVAKDKLQVPDSINLSDEEVARLFMGDPQS